MNKKGLIYLSIALLLIFGSAFYTPCEALYAYAPMNAVAAEPNTPYNLDNIPKCSRVYYVPCPAWAPFATYLPDVPPASASFPGPFGVCVPVP
jgi:hypothetical protein